MIKSLIISCILVVASCQQYRVVGKKITPEATNLTIPYFDKNNFDYLYTAKININKNDLNGIFVVKKIDENSKRIALLSDFGNTIFDFEYVDGKFNLKYIIEDLNKRIVIQKLKKYFELIIKSNYTIKSTYENEGELIHISKIKSKRVKIAETNNVYNKVEKVSRLKIKAEVLFYSNSSLADSILFKSFEFPLEMKFYRMSK
jgi:hypothetical protein